MTGRLGLAACAAAFLWFGAGCDERITNSGKPLPPGGVEFVFDPAAGTLPFPTDLVGRDAQGTLDIDVGPGDPDARAALSSLDGFSLTNPISIPYTGLLPSSSVRPGVNLRVFEATLDPRRGGVLSALGRELAPLAEWVPFVADEQLLIIPTRPLAPAQGYVVAVTDGFLTGDARPVRRSPAFSFVIYKDPLLDDTGATTLPVFLDDDQAAALEPARRILVTYADALEGKGIVRDEIALTFGFTTQSVGAIGQALVDAVLDDAATLALAGDVRTHPAPVLNTGALNPPDGPASFAGIADLYAAALRLPLYTDPAAPLTGAFGPGPSPRAEVIVPALIAAPAAGLGLVRPAAGWPVVVFQHAVTGDRTQVVAVAEALVSAGFVVVAPDLPLHGLTQDPAHPLAALAPLLGTDGPASIYAMSPAFAGFAPAERTFGLDVVDNATSAPGPDGSLDPSGTHFFQLGSVRTARDNLRQATADLLRVTRLCAHIDLDGDGAPDLDPGRVAVLGHSLGAMVALLAAAHDPVARPTAAANPAGGLLPMLLASDTFGPRIEAQLEQAGAAPGTDAFTDFVVAAQSVLDAADPVVFASDVDGPLLVLEQAGGRGAPPDTVFPNVVAGAPLAGTEALAAQLGLSPAAAGPNQDTRGLRTLWRVAGGGHPSLLDPGLDRDVTVAMQTAVVTFLASGGTSTGVLPAELVASAP